MAETCCICRYTGGDVHHAEHRQSLCDDPIACRRRFRLSIPDQWGFKHTANWPDDAPKKGVRRLEVAPELAEEVVQGD